MADQIVREYPKEPLFQSAFKRISWGAVFAGSIVAVTVYLVLSLLGIAIGVATINPTTEQNPAQGLGIGAIIWWAVMTLISFFIGGCVAGRLAGVGRKVDAMLHGVVTWGLATLFTLFVFTSAVGALFGGATQLLSGVAQNPVAARQIQEPSGAQNSTEAAKSKMKQALEAAGKTPAEADQVVDAWAKKLQGQEPAGAEANQSTAQTSETIATSVSAVAWAGFIALIIGLIGAALGGASGVPRDLRNRTVVTTGPTAA